MSTCVVRWSRKQVDNTKTHNNHSHQDQTPINMGDQHNSSRPDYQRSNPHTLNSALQTPWWMERRGTQNVAHKPPCFFCILSLINRHHPSLSIKVEPADCRQPCRNLSNASRKPPIFNGRKGRMRDEPLVKCRENTKEKNVVRGLHEASTSTFPRLVSQEKSRRHFSWGIEPGRDHPAGTCSRSSRHQQTPWGNPGSSDQTRHSCSTSCR
ncbi:hypothetical protein B0J13DRAFT_300804 [Dactylonectria estremocensis]|uniref:Uncharacterized protein n=1 Tax=Dactylonectria estremocensis TaxID=1079267 RepID=A0A9P9F116_9HYPO|nr:hypothetical protein B0J13DRAFT_300804 [Dactylonectria estremocensis]